MPNTTRVVVSSRLPGGHRRAGRLWSQAQAEVEVDEKALAALKADEHLVVVEVPASQSQGQQKPQKQEKPGS